ncbi:hypothetical protein RJ641_013848 [Dillenia turbinata]|uniref:Uncharacterized protein n=1 Tax=Dillenia turbinata TaxID=194707 RepID=A0AAN8ZLT1_9MAGN
MMHLDLINRRTLIFAVNEDAEKLFKQTVEVDRLIDSLRDASADEASVLHLFLDLELLYFKLLYSETSVLCLQKDYEELASSVMSIVDRIVHKTNEKIESATDVLKEILIPIVDEGNEISWPPRDPNALTLMENLEYKFFVLPLYYQVSVTVSHDQWEIIQREKEGQLDEGFLSEVNAQLWQVCFAVLFINVCTCICFLCNRYDVHIAAFACYLKA